MLRRSLHSLLISTALLAAACGKPAAPAGPQTIETATFDPSLKVDLKSSTKQPSGLYYRDLVVGTGAEVTNGMDASVAYVLWTIDGKQVEASPAGEPYTFKLGTQAVIPGWDYGVVGMRVGGKRQLIVPPEMAYGPQGQGAIGPNAILVFVVEVTAAK